MSSLLLLSLLSIITIVSLVSGGKVCSYLGMDGIAYPVGECMYHSEQDPSSPDKSVSFAFEFMCGQGTISAEYWEDSTVCRGEPDLEMDGYYCSANAELTGQECKCIGRGKACDTFRIDFVTSKFCKKQSQNNDEDSVEQSQSTAIVVNECVPNGMMIYIIKHNFYMNIYML